MRAYALCRRAEVSRVQNVHPHRHMEVISKSRAISTLPDDLCHQGAGRASALKPGRASLHKIPMMKEDITRMSNRTESQSPVAFSVHALAPSVTQLSNHRLKHTASSRVSSPAPQNKVMCERVRSARRWSHCLCPPKPDPEPPAPRGPQAPPVSASGATHFSYRSTTTPDEYIGAVRRMQCLRGPGEAAPRLQPLHHKKQRSREGVPPCA